MTFHLLKSQVGIFFQYETEHMKGPLLISQHIRYGDFDSDSTADAIDLSGSFRSLSRVDFDVNEVPLQIGAEHRFQETFLIRFC